jgi:TolB-like protein/tetratricopeptide (TPR) repeat protein/predicted Ser/Thr protein kinase
MDADRWRQISRLYHEALERPVDERSAFLDVACRGDEALRVEVDSLLANEASAHAFLAAPAAEVVADRFLQYSPTRDGGLKPGVKLGTYQIVRRLGRGGMGVVFLAHDTTLHRQVALKVLGSPTDDETARVQLLREARNAAALNHSNICTVYEVGEADGRAFIAMEYVDGRPLSDRLAESALPMEEALRYGIEAADALAYAHDHGVVHRDLKAANAIVTTTGRLKLVDFGLARREDALLVDATTMPSLVAAGVAVGTPYSMAPEQVRGGVTDARTDIWALGVLLYEMVSGGKPFGAVTIPELFSSILKDAPAPLPNGVPVDVQAVIERCLEKEPDRRYHRADEVRARLEAIQAGTIPLWATWHARMRRHPWMTAAAAGIALITLLVGVDLGGVRERFGGSPVAEDPIKLAVLPFENLTGDPEQEYFSDGLTDEMITELGRLHPQRLSVIARTSSMPYKNRDAPIDQIGRELGVDYVLEGSARREGGRVRISATLIQVRDQSQRWADTFDRELAGILALQSDVAREVARQVRLRLTPQEETRLAATRAVNPDAYDAVLKGRLHASILTRNELDTAQHYFDLALEKDPNYAPSYAGIANVWLSRRGMWYAEPKEAAEKAMAAIQKALALDNSLAVVLAALARIQANVQWEWKEAESTYRRALEIEPNRAGVHAGYAGILRVLGRPTEAIEHFERAIELDPLNPSLRSLYALNLGYVGRYDEAIDQARRALAAQPNQNVAHEALSLAFSRKGMLKEAVEALIAAAKRDEDFEKARILQRGYDEGRYRAALVSAAELLEARVQHQAARPTKSGAPSPGTPVVVSAGEIAMLYDTADLPEKVLDWWEKAVERRDPEVSDIRATLPRGNIREDNPRFQAVLRKTGLP